MEAHRVFFAWEPRADRLEVSAKQLLASIEWLRALPELQGPFTAARGMPCDDEADATRALLAGAYPKTGEPQYYKQYFYLGSFRRYTAKITFGTGMREVAFGEQTPNRIDLLVRAPLAPLALRQIMVGLIGIFKPVWGFAASDRFPAQPAPGDGSPGVGWLTYLSGWFGPPPPLPPPVLVSHMKTLGAIYQAFPDAFDPAREDHRAQIRALEKALRATGTLRPYAPSGAPLPLSQG